MVWDVEIGKQVSMIILMGVLILIFINYKKIEKVNLFFFAGFVIFSLLDFFCYFYFKFIKMATDTFYVIGGSVVFFLYLLYYYQLFDSKLLKNIQTVIMVIFLVNVFCMLYFEENFLGRFSFNMLYVNLLLLTFSIILFLYQTFNSDKIFEIKNYLPFWISVSSLIYYIGIIPIFYFRTKVSPELYFFILFLLNLINNGVLVFGLFWNKPDKFRQT
ncbi:hypothetical protein SAMN05421769_2353 [Chryseobacterium scophthalmum]|jgi:hypothetical protein|uniref:YhhN-like protein n=1 Tax=Chryseobacterium scophthalmum TaxID=59733 RepID=A0A1N6HAQ0_9FLAO|nr:hypothetical protein SAMN05421769_2353 [Chryseobacterium scophthalmum]